MVARENHVAAYVAYVVVPGHSFTTKTLLDRCPGWEQSDEVLTWVLGTI